MTLSDLLKLTKKWILAVSVILRILLSVFNVFISILIQIGINNIMGISTSLSLKYISILMVGGSFTFILVYYAYNYMVLEWITEINLKMGENLIRKLLRRKNNLNSDLSEGKILNFISEDMEAISNFLKFGLLPLVDMLITLIAGIIYVFYGNFIIGLVFIFAGLIILFINKKNSRSFEAAYEDFAPKNDDFLSILEKIFHSIPIMRTLTRSLWVKKDFDNKFNDKRKSFINYFSVYGKMQATTEGSIGIIELLVLCVGLVLVAKGQIVFGTLIGIWNAGLGSIIYPIGSLPDYFSYYNRYKVSSLRTKEFFELHDKNIDDDNLIKRISEEKNIIIDNINFSYGNKKIFENFSAIIPGRGITFITGDSGKGKSTLFQLIFNELNLDGGSIIFETPDDVSLSFVPQKNTFFLTSIMNNLSLYNDNISKEEIIKVCDEVNILDVINKLPDKFDTEYRGQLLSNGQKCRLSVVRALINNPDYIFLDEPFSDLDMENQKFIMEILKKESKKRGIVIITHTLDFIEHADNHIKVGE